MAEWPTSCSTALLIHATSPPERIRHLGFIHHGSLTVIVVRVVEPGMSETRMPVGAIDGRCYERLSSHPTLKKNRPKRIIGISVQPAAWMPEITTQIKIAKCPGSSVAFSSLTGLFHRESTLQNSKGMNYSPTTTNPPIHMAGHEGLSDFVFVPTGKRLCPDQATGETSILGGYCLTLTE